MGFPEFWVLGQERAAAIGPEQGPQSGYSNRVGASRNGVNGNNDRLPGAVVLARERLLERLRGMPPSETRLESFIL